MRWLRVVTLLECHHVFYCVQPYPEETSYAQSHLKSKPYREDAEKLEAELHALSDELFEAKISILEDKGYEAVHIDGLTLMVPSGLTMEQLFTALQQVPPDMDDQHKLTYLVAEEDRHAISNASAYREIVERREDIVKQIHGVYEQFWDEIVQSEVDTEAEAIVYMLAGMNRQIDAQVLSDITGVPFNTCKSFKFDDDGIVIRVE